MSRCNNPDCDPQLTTCLDGWGRDVHRCEFYMKDSLSVIAKLGMKTAIDNGDPIKALCWKQPFASLMLPPFDKIETRTRPIAYRGLVLIVATAVPYTDRQLVELCGGTRALEIQMSIEGHDGYMNSCAVGIGYLDDCRPITKQDAPKTFLRTDVAIGRHGWHFKSVHAIEPIPMKGFQGWRNVDSETRSKIELL